ncbi:hypothetical protein SRIMM317S_03096 [Streptomyces rimosus subsp. rimosus]
MGTIRELWEGAPVYVQDGLGNHVEVELHPQPVQPELPIWLTCTKSVETFETAGRLGCNVLTALIDMTNEELEEKLAVYYKTLEEYGHDPGQHHGHADAAHLHRHRPGRGQGDRLAAVQRLSRAPSSPSSTRRRRTWRRRTASATSRPTTRTN